MSAHQYVLTDVSAGIFLEEFSLAASPELQMAGSNNWSVTKKRLKGGLADGIDVVELNNGFFSFSILPTRGMGIWKGHCGGIDLGWKSPVSFPVNPAFVDLASRNGLGWLNGFNELLCRCGLVSNGPPGIDENGPGLDQNLTLHGRIANIPAHRVEINISTDSAGEISICGHTSEETMFGSHLGLKTTVSAYAGCNRLRVVDEVTNLGGQPAEMQMLYHTNIGRPFLEEGAQFIAPIASVAPRDEQAAEGIESYSTYDPPTPGYAEQAFYFDLQADQDENTIALLKNSAGDKGFSLRFNKRQLPCFTLWKNTQAENEAYVTGLEPGTNFPNFKSFERDQGRVVVLEPAETYRMEFEIEIHSTNSQVAKIEQEIESLQSASTPIVHHSPQTNFSPT